MDISIFSPFAKNHHAWQDLMAYTNKNRATIKTISVSFGILTASVLVGALTFGVGGIALFRVLVKNCIPSDKKTQSIASAHLSPKYQKLTSILDLKLQQSHPYGHKLRDFLLNKEFRYTPSDYDLGYEDFFDVGWIDPRDQNDLAFLQKMHKDYPNAIKKLQDNSIDPRNRFELNDATRLANNNIAGLFQAAQRLHCPEIQALLKEALIHCILKRRVH